MTRNSAVYLVIENENEIPENFFLPRICIAAQHVLVCCSPQNVLIAAVHSDH